jgi:signal peptidase I
MSKLHLLFGALGILGLVLVVLGPADKRLENGEPVHTVQAGYLMVIVGLFGLLAQHMSFAAAMMAFVALALLIIVLDRAVLRGRRAPEVTRPDWVEYAYSFFPVILVVFLLRSFVAEPYQIPSSSMRPGLIVGDFILVNKFSYGVRLPVLNKVLIPTGQPQRGDVMVFEYPRDRTINFIKRVVGLPGDVVEYRNKVLTINGKMMAQTPNGYYAYQEGGPLETRNPQRLTEALDGHTHEVLVEPGVPPINLANAYEGWQLGRNAHAQNCEIREDGFRCTVPAGHYFAMGDNRDNSSDGRYWGFIPDDHVLGRAFLVWLNLGDLGRVGTAIR